MFLVGRCQHCSGETNLLPSWVHHSSFKDWAQGIKDEHAAGEMSDAALLDAVSLYSQEKGTFNREHAVRAARRESHAYIGGIAYASSSSGARNA